MKERNKGLRLEGIFIFLLSKENFMVLSPKWFVYFLLHTLCSCFLSRHLPTICFTPFSACLFSMVSGHFPHDVPATLAFFLRLTLTELFCLQVLVMLYEKCLSKSLSATGPFFIFRPQSQSSEAFLILCVAPLVLPQILLTERFFSFVVHHIPWTS